MKGGNVSKIVPSFIPPNDPSVPLERKRISKEIREAQPIPVEKDNKLLELSIYSEPEKKQSTRVKGVELTDFMPNYQQNPYFQGSYPMGTFTQPMQMMQMMGMSGMRPPVIVKQYNMNTAGPVELGVIYEDQLPNIPSTSKSIGERLTQSNYVRSVMFGSGDGNDVSLTGEGDESLLSRVKLNVLNPYNIYRLSNNPYKGLPKDFIIYNSCYPIRKNTRPGDSIICARGSMGVNVRIYRLDEQAYLLTKMEGNDKGSIMDHDQWRDITFYEYVREYIIKKKICPHFTVLYGYYLSSRSNVDFDRINQYRDKEEKYTIRTEPATQGKNQGYVIEMKKRHKDDFNKSLVALTESYNYNIFGWATKQYSGVGNRKQMVLTGFHTEDVWMSILFQIMVAINVMQLKGIVINNFSLESNVYIKDLFTGGRVSNHWEYRINGIRYYLPNIGYIVMIDSNFRDLEDKTGFTLGHGVKEPKISGKMFGEGTIGEGIINSQNLLALFNAMNPDNFGQDFVNSGGVRPPTEVLEIMKNICEEINSTQIHNISYYIEKFMRKFMNNRIGTYLKESEEKNIRKNGTNQFKRGDMIVFESEQGVPTFGTYIDTSDSGIATILTKEDIEYKDIIETNMAESSIFEYIRTEPIQQNITENTNFTDTIETYII